MKGLNISETVYYDGYNNMRESHKCLFVKNSAPAIRLDFVFTLFKWFVCLFVSQTNVDLR